MMKYIKNNVSEKEDSIYDSKINIHYATRTAIIFYVQRTKAIKLALTK